MHRFPHRFAALIAILAIAGACAEDPAGPDAPLYPTIESALDVPLDPDTRANNRLDALRLAARHMRDAETPTLPRDLVASLYNALTHVARSDHPARDSALDLYRVRTPANPAVDRLLVVLDPDHDWTGAWLDLEPTTGHATIDAMVSEHDLSITENYPDLPIVLLSAPAPLNTYVLARQLEAVAGVRNADADLTFGDGSDIQARATPNGWELDYIFRFGDCLSGCTGEYTWSFFVDETGGVQFQGSGGTPELPSPAPPAPEG